MDSADGVAAGSVTVRKVVGPGWHNRLWAVEPTVIVLHVNGEQHERASCCVCVLATQRASAARPGRVGTFKRAVVVRYVFMRHAKASPGMLCRAEQGWMAGRKCRVACGTCNASIQNKLEGLGPPRGAVASCQGVVSGQYGMCAKGRRVQRRYVAARKRLLQATSTEGGGEPKAA